MAQQTTDTTPAPLATTTPAPLAPQERVIGMLEPRGFDQAMQVADMVAKGRLFNVDSKEEAFIRMATGASLGIPPIQALRSIFVVKGQPVISASMLQALCLGRPDICEKFELVSSDDEKAVYLVKRRGRAERTFEYTRKDAVQAGYFEKGKEKDNYVRHPAAMFRARCRSMAADVEFPDITRGMVSAEEMEAERDRAAIPTTGTVSTVEEPRKAVALRERIAAAGNKDELTAAWAQAGRDHSHGDVNDTELADLKAAVAERKAALKAKAEAKPEQATPPVAETVTTTPNGTTHDQDGVVQDPAKG